VVVSGGVWFSIFILSVNIPQVHITSFLLKYCIPPFFPGPHHPPSSATTMPSSALSPLSLG